MQPEEISILLSAGVQELINYWLDKGDKVLVINNTGELLYQRKQGFTVITPCDDCQDPVKMVDERW
jgi:hypothetical protein